MFGVVYVYVDVFGFGVRFLVEVGGFVVVVY